MNAACRSCAPAALLALTACLSAGAGPDDPEAAQTAGIPSSGHPDTEDRPSQLRNIDELGRRICDTIDAIAPIYPVHASDVHSPQTLASALSGLPDSHSNVTLTRTLQWSSSSAGDGAGNDDAESCIVSGSPAAANNPSRYRALLQFALHLKRPGRNHDYDHHCLLVVINDARTCIARQPGIEEGCFPYPDAMAGELPGDGMGQLDDDLALLDCASLP
jgi:hypothetical protein